MARPAVRAGEERWLHRWVFREKGCAKIRGTMAVAEVKSFGPMPEVARLTQTPHCGAYGFYSSETLGGSLISKDDQSALPP